MKLYLLIGVLYVAIFAYMTFKVQENRHQLVTHFNNGVSRYGATKTTLIVIALVTCSIVLWPIEALLLIYKKYIV